MGLMIAGTKSGVGKTTITMGILASLSRRMKVQAFKVGPDYIDPSFHTMITKRYCRNLDSYLMSEDVIRYLYSSNSLEADISIVEGVMGLYDGAEVGSDIGTSASIAKMLKLPVILVVDGSKVASSIAAVAKGYNDFDPEVSIEGIIINNVGSKAHYELLAKAIRHYTDITPCGYLVKNTNLSLPERHLGLTPVDELSSLESYYDNLADLVEESIDMESIIEISKKNEFYSNAVIENPYAKHIDKMKNKINQSGGLTIGVAKDEAFHFYYRDNIELLKNMGVNIVYFSPIHDENLPSNINGVIFGGGFPEMFSKELEQNVAFKKTVLDSLSNGIPYHAECGGLMYLCNQLTNLEGETFDMVGLLDGSTSMTQRLQRFGYAYLKLKKDCIFGTEGDTIKIHEFHRSNADIDNEKVFKLYKLRGGEVFKEWTCGYEKYNGIGAYAHIHYYNNIQFAINYLEKCLEYRKGENDGIHKRS